MGVGGEVLHTGAVIPLHGVWQGMAGDTSLAPPSIAGSGLALCAQVSPWLWKKINTEVPQALLGVAG